MQPFSNNRIISALSSS